MPLLITYTEIRPSTAVNFIEITAEDKQYLEDTYPTSTSTWSRTVSEDGLTRFLTVTYDNISEFHQVMADPIAIEIGDRKMAACMAAGISRTMNITS